MCTWQAAIMTCRLNVVLIRQRREVMVFRLPLQVRLIACIIIIDGQLASILVLAVLCFYCCCFVGMWPQSRRLGLEAASMPSNASPRSRLERIFKRLGLASASGFNASVSASVSAHKASVTKR